MVMERKAIYTIHAMWLGEMLRFWRAKSRMIGALATPLTYLVFLAPGLIAGFQLKGGGAIDIGFFAPGFIGMSVLFAALFSGGAIIWEREFGILKGTLVAPVSRFFTGTRKGHRLRYDNPDSRHNDTNFCLYYWRALCLSYRRASISCCHVSSRYWVYWIGHCTCLKNPESRGISDDYGFHDNAPCSAKRSVFPDRKPASLATGSCICKPAYLLRRSTSLASTGQVYNPHLIGRSSHYRVCRHHASNSSRWI